MSRARARPIHPPARPPPRVPRLSRAAASDASAPADARVVTGTVRARGLDGAFELLVDECSGAFRETCALETPTGARLIARSGRSARGTCWDADWYGDVRVNAMDGAHLSTLQTWCRMNGTAREAVRGRVRMKKLVGGVSASMAVREYGARVAKRVEEGGGVKKKGRAREDAGRRGTPRGATSVYAVTMMDGGKVGGRVFVDESTNAPWRAEFYHQRGVETWTYEDWEEFDVGDGAKVSTPRVARRMNSEGQVTTYRAEKTTAARGDVSRDVFSLPASRTTEWASERSWREGQSDVAAIRGEGGHVLVKPVLESGSQGWFVLDTASTGLAISPEAAESCSMPSFGTMSIAGVAAPLDGALRRGRELAVGALRVSSPIYMEQNLDGAVRIPNGERLAGVLGVPALAHAIVRVHAPMRVPGSRDAPKLTVSFFDPASYAPSAEVERNWQPVTWIDGVPYVELAYTIANDGFRGVTTTVDERKGLFKLSLGTGGTGAVLSARVARDAQVAERTKALQPGGIMSGPGESSGRLQRVGDEIVTGRIETVRFKNFEFTNVRAVMHTDGDPPDADLSPHADGAVCADLFRACELVLDLNSANPRIAVVPP